MIIRILGWSLGVYSNQSYECALRPHQVTYLPFSIGLPFALLIYQTLLLRLESTPSQYGKWFLLFVLTSLGNLASLLSDSYLFLLVDLALKVGVCFLPAPVVPHSLLRTTNSNTF